MRLLLLCFLFLGYQGVWGQDQPIYNQFYFNPYLYNPAFLGESEGFELNFTHKRQWTEITDAPTTSAFNLQYASKGNIRLGLSFQSQEAVALKSNTVYFTFGYRVNFSQSNFLQFGLSTGALQNKLDLDEISRTSDTDILNDPAVLGAVDNTIYLASQFGIQYSLDRLTLGLALPKLLRNNVNSVDDFNAPQFDEFEQFIATASYDVALSPFVDLRPLVLYRHVNSQQYQLELSALVLINNKVWIGGGYRSDAGIIGHAGINLKEMLSFAYSYNSGVDELGSLGGNHEITLKLRLKKRKNRIISNHSDLDRSTDENSRVYHDEVEPFDSLNEARGPELDTMEDNTVMDETQESELSELVLENNETMMSNDGTGLEPGHYLVVGVFASETNAKTHLQEILKTYGEAKVSLNKQNNFYYVYLFRTSDIRAVRIKWSQVRQLDIFDFKDAWILHIN